MWGGLRWAALALVVGACSSCPKPEPQVRVLEKAVPVPMPCVDDKTPPPPKYAATLEDLKKASPGERYALAVGGFIERDQRLKEIEPIIEACRK